MKTSTRPPIPSRWFECWTKGLDGKWFIATAGGRPDLLNAQAKGVAEKFGLAVVVSVRKKVLKKYRRRISKPTSTPVRKSVRLTPRAPRVKAPQELDA